MLRQRVITTIVLLPILIAAIWFGGCWLTLLVAAIATAGVIEFYRLDRNKKLSPLHYFGIIVTIALILLPYFFNHITIVHILSVTVVVSLIWLLFSPRKEHAFNQWAWIMAGILYLGLMLGFWVKLRNIDQGRDYVFWLLFIIIINDSAAYFTGKALGRHALAPRISPKKTWEGAIGGLIASILISVLFGFIFSLPLSYRQLVIMGIGASILAQLGDLIESLLKRNSAVKDSGTIMPGHGGILDRIDSYILTAAVAYYVITALV
jgi:phosphatidate cytidylyltransferase